MSWEYEEITSVWEGWPKERGSEKPPASPISHNTIENNRRHSRIHAEWKKSRRTEFSWEQRDRERKE